MLPNRRASITSPLLSYGHSSRAHRSTESTTVNTSIPPTSGLPSTMSPPYSAGGNGQHDKVVHALISRLMIRLPCHSGISLQILEADRAIKQTVETLIQIARVRLDLVVHSLNDLLEKITKAFPPVDSDGTISLEVLHSQLYVLKVLSAAMTYRWQCYREGLTPEQPQQPDPSSPTSSSARPPPTIRLDSKAPIPPRPEWIEPPKLEEPIAKYALSVMVLFLRQTASVSDRPKTSGHMHSASFPEFQPLEMASPLPPAIRHQTSLVSSSSLGSRMSSQSLRPNGHRKRMGAISSSQSQPNFFKMMKQSVPPSPNVTESDAQNDFEDAMPQSSLSPEGHSPSDTLMPLTPSTVSSSSASINWLISKYAAKIVFHLSASNWQVVFAKIRNKIRHFAQSDEETPDMVDMKLVSCSALDRVKLVQVMQELSSLLVSMKRDVQGAVSIALRTALWNWIEYFPKEYLEIFRGTKRLDGTPERVFDMLFNMTESASKRAFWPTLTILLAASPERLKQATLGVPKSKKQNNFVETLVKSLTSTSKTAEIAMVCLIDFCKAAAYIPPDFEHSALRNLAPELADDLRNRIFNPTPPMKPFYDTTDMIDVDLYADALVAIYRFNHRVAVEAIFPACIAPERSDAVKTCVLKACLSLIGEAHKIPGQPPLSSLFPLIANRTRMLVRSAVNRKHEAPGGGVRRPIAKRYNTDSLPDRDQMILTIFLIWRSEPGFIFYGVAPSDPEYEALLSDAVKLFVQPTDKVIKMTVMKTIMDLTSIALPLREDQEWYLESRTHRNHAGAKSTTAAAVQLLESRDTFEDERIALNILNEICDMGIEALSSYALPLPGKSVETGSPNLSALSIAELALYVALTSSQADLPWLAASGLRKLLEVEEHGQAPPIGLTKEQGALRKQVYLELGDNKVVRPGRLAVQKWIRKATQKMSYPSAMNVAIWEECYRKWVNLTEIVTRPSSEDPDPNTVKPYEKKGTAEDRQAEWQNITLFLASFGGCCLTEDNRVAPLSSILNLEDLPSRFHHSPRLPIPAIKQFIGQAVDLLVADSVVARETVKDAIGNELNPALFPMLFAQIDLVVSAIFDQQMPAWEDHIIVFVEQCISVLKLIFDRLQDLSETAQVHVDIGKLVQYLARYIHRSGTSISALRIKMKYAALLDALFTKRDLVPLRKEVALRNTLLDIVAEWAFDTVDGPMSERDAQQRLQNDLDLACLRTIVQLLDRLQLQPVDGTTRSESVHVQSRLFYRYFNLFIKALQRWKSGEGDWNDVDSVSSGHVRNRSNPKEQHHLREMIISGLTNLLSANMEAGLKHCLPMGYNEDPRARKIFVHIFARVLKQGTSFVTVSTGEESVSRLCEMIRAPDMSLVMAICETCPQSDIDDMIGVLLNVFDTRGSLVSLLKAIIDREVAATADEAALFRGNTMCTRLLSQFARIHGYNYLRTLLAPLIAQMSRVNHSYELDPSKLRPGEELDINEQNLKVICQAFLDVICESVPGLPNIFREICNHISVSVANVWPEAKYSAVGGFIFLRFICPAIVSPSTVDIEVPTDNHSIQRGLILITKVIQNLANNILFGKEAFMTMLNKFLTNNIMPVTRFLSEVLKYAPAPGETDQAEWLGLQYDETDHMLLHRYFHVNADKVGKELLSSSGPPVSQDSEQGPSGGKQTWDNLCATLVEIGAPLEIPKPSAIPASQHPRFQEFIQRNSHRNTDGVRDIFLESPVPKDRTPVFILSLYKVNVETVDLELLASYIFRTIISTGSKPFDIIIDCTNFTSSSEIPIQWFKFFLELTPSDLMQRCTTAYLLNPNGHAQKFLRRLYHLFQGLSLAKTVVASSSVAELLPLIHPISVSLMSYSLGLEREPKEVFSQVNKLERHRMYHPVNLQVGTSHLRITTTKPRPIWGYVTCKLTEIVMLSDVDDVYHVASGQDTNEFAIRRNRSGGNMYFSAASRDSVVKAIRTAKGKLKADGPPSAVERPVHLGNLSATLLNVGLLNVGHEDELLRGAAYDLLCAICKHMQCEDPMSLPVDGAFIPSNPSAFAIQFSERMAKFAPHLTLDFLTEFFVGFDKSSSAHKAVCLQYMSPWIQNLSGFQNPSTSYYERSAAKLRDVIRCMIDVTFNHNEVYPMLQRLIWAEMSRVDNRVVHVALDELFRAAIDGGISSRRCESIADTLVMLGSINVRGKVLAKLRRILGKITVKPTRSLVENPAWNEVAALTRLTMVVMYNNRVPVQTQLFVPEIVHLVTMLAASGPVILRTSVYGLVTNLVQSLCIARTEDDVGKDRLRRLLRHCSTPETLRLFGLAREDTSSEYTLLDPLTEQTSVDNLETIANFLLEIVEAGAQTVGLGNSWRARWVGLVTSTAFLLSAYMQSRAFVILGALASSDVDDDLLYQILVAFKTALMTSNENDTTAIVSMLRCIRKLVPGLPENSRYLPHILWLAVALIQSSYVSLFAESARLLQTALEALEKQGAFEHEDVASVLISARAPLEDISSQLDSVLGLSFQCSFSFSMATAIFKGIRHPPTRDAAGDALLALLRISIRTSSTSLASGQPIDPESLGYFLALLPLATDNSKYRQLLEDAGMGGDWATGIPALEDDDEEGVPKVPFSLLGVGDTTSALLAISFIVAMINSAHTEREYSVLFLLLASASETYPEMVALTYEAVTDKINETFANSHSPAILEAVSIVFQTAVADQLWPSAANGSSASIDPAEQQQSGNHVFALNKIGMPGLVNNHQFLPANRSIPLIKWIHELVSRIIE